jgi:outer membrane protein assembly factor BamB
LTKPLEISILALVSIICITAFTLWFIHDPVSELSVSVPGLDMRPDKDETQGDVVIIGEKFIDYAAHSSGLTGKWTQFRGADFDNIVKDKTPLIDSWGTEDPKILWEVDLGEGHAAPVIWNGRAYILDYDEIKKADALRCFALETGEQIWKRSYSVQVKRNHGMSRTIPAVNEKYIVTIGPRGHVMCNDPLTGDFFWGIDLVKEYNSEIPFWYTGQCPFIDNDIAIIAPGGTSMIIGVDCETGEVIWETPNPNAWKMSHSSVMPMTFDGKKMYIYAAIGGLCGISAEEEDAGKILWETTEFAPSVVAPSPITFDDGKIFITAGYGAGAAMLQLKKTGSSFSVEVLQMYKPKEGMASEQQTPIVVDGLMYGVLPKDAGGPRNQFVCCDPNDCTNYLWTSGKTHRFGLGPYVIADGKIFILDDNGTLTIAKLTNTGLNVLDEKRIIEGQDAWGPIAIADGYLLMRDSKKMVCLDMRGE